MYETIFKHKDSDGDELELFHNTFYDEYFLKVGEDTIQVNYQVLNKLTDKFLEYNNYFED